jgi:HAD superfamily hydrolase (TIGR01549 family)
LAYQAFIFDFDGVIVDSTNVKRDCFLQFYRRWPEHFNHMQKYTESAKGTSRYDQFKELLKKQNIAEPLWEKKLAEYSLEFSLLTKKFVAEAALVDGILEFLSFLNRKKIPVAVVSNTPHEELIYLIKLKNLETYFEFIFGATKEKRKVENLNTILSHKNFPLKQSVLIGDTVEDFKAAQKVGISLLGIRHSGSTLPESVKSFSHHFELMEFLFHE